MAKALLLSISLCLLFLFNGCLARLQYQQLNDCLLNQLRAMEPDNRIQAEAGEIESWNPKDDEFQCAGVAVLRRTIQPRGLLLPSFSNAPQVTYIIRGEGVTGILIPGCPETFQESQRSQQGQGSQGFQDRHQKVRRFGQGDVLVMPAGVAHWCYNDGDEPVVAVTLLDTANSANQLDNDPRSFYLAGSSDDEFQQQQSEGERHGRREQQGKSNNVMAGYDTRLLAEVFKINEQVARKIQGENDYRGNIVYVEGGLQFVLPPKIQEEWEQQYRVQGRQANAGFCTLRLKENIGSSRHADIFNPEAGLISIVNSHKLPVLRHVQLSVERGVLFNESLDVPHWTINAHSIVYGIDGEARIQVVDNRGQNVFDGVLREGQILVVPQNFAVVKRCESDRFEWVAFKTNDNAMVAPLADRSSVIRALPLDVISNAFQLSEQDAWRFKFSRKEVRVVPGRSSRSQRWADV